MRSTESVKLLQAGADSNIVEYDGWSPHYWADTNEHVEICKLLLEHDAYIDALDGHGQPLVTELFLEVMIWLLLRLNDSERRDERSKG